ncbi:MAG: SIMPL domain-containing protein [Dialister sp.]
MKKLAVALVAGLIACSCMTAQAEDSRRSITTTGNGVVIAQNNRAVMYLAVETMSPDAKQAAQDNANIMTKVKHAVIGAGAAPDKIETDNYTMYPVYEYDKGKVKSRKYEVNNRMKVVVEDLTKAGTVMDAAISAGANRIENIMFTVRNPGKYKDDALREAAQDARRKADIIAASLGKTVTNIISVTDNSVRVSPRNYMMNARMAGGNDMAESATTPMEGGDAKVESSVTVVFEIV